MEKKQNRRFTEDDNEYIRKHWPTDDKEAVAAHLGRSVHSLENQASALGVHRICDKWRWSDDDLRILKEMCAQGLPFKQIMQSLSRSRTYYAIHSMAQRMGYLTPRQLHNLEEAARKTEAQRLIAEHRMRISKT
jgi:hypothetical protein